VARRNPALGVAGNPAFAENFNHKRFKAASNAIQTRRVFESKGTRSVYGALPLCCGTAN
jgi:hypothetical protein